MTSGIVRKIDLLGRVIVPAEIRRTHGWAPGVAVEFIPDTNGGITIRTYGDVNEKEHVIKNLNIAIETGNLSEIDLAIREAIRYIRNK